VVDSKIFQPDLLYCRLRIQTWYWGAIAESLVQLFLRLSKWTDNQTFTVKAWYLLRLL